MNFILLDIMILLMKLTSKMGMSSFHLVSIFKDFSFPKWFLMIFRHTAFSDTVLQAT